MIHDSSGASVPDRALVSDQAATRLDPPGFDPSRTLLITVPSIVGDLARWAVRQSPYPAPDNMTAALAAFEAQFLGDPDWTLGDLRMMKLTFDGLYDAVWAAIEAVPEIVAWNTPKSGHDATMVFSSRYDGPAPDDDFIDLHALASNVTRSVWKEAEEEAEWDAVMPCDSDGSAEGGETAQTGSTVGESAGPQDIAQPLAHPSPSGDTQ